MKHSFFEELLFAQRDDSEEKLNSEQLIALQEHLESCESCRLLSESWQQVEAQLRNAPQIKPAPGFTARWQARLAEDRLRLHRRQSLMLLAFSLVGAFLLLGSLIVLSLPWLKSPDMLFWAWIYRVFVLVSQFASFQETLTPMIQGSKLLIPILGLPLLVGLITEVGVLWVVSLRMILRPRRVTK